MPYAAQSHTAKRMLSLVVIAAGWLFMFRNEFSLIQQQWDTEDYSYCYLVPLLFAYAMWSRRDALLENAGDATSWPGFIGLLLSGLLLFAGRLGSLETFIFLSMWLSIVSICAIALGWRKWKALAYPALLLLFIVPPPSYIEKTLSLNLRLISSQLSALFLQMLSIPVFLEGNIIDLGTIQLHVVDACSGLRYFLPTILLSLIVGETINKSLAARAALVVLSAPITIVLNAIRITVTGVLVKHVSPTLASGFFHDFQGWVIYLAAVALLAGASVVLRTFERKPAAASAASPAADEAPPRPEPADRTARSFALSKTVVASLLLCAFSVATSAVMAKQAVPAWRSLDSFPLQVGDWRGARSYLDKETLDALWADDYFLATYQNSSTGEVLNLLVPFYKTQSAKHTAHAPTSCLLGSGWEITGRRVLGPSAATGRSFPLQQLILKKNGQVYLSNFWFQQRGRIIADELANKGYLLYDALTMRRTDGALVRVEMLVRRGRTVEQAQAELDRFAAEVSSTLDGFLPGATGRATGLNQP